MRRLRPLFLWVLAAACGSAQPGNRHCCEFPTTPAQLDGWEDSLQTPPVPANGPSGDSVSVARLRHQPRGKARAAFLRGMQLDRSGAYKNAAAEFQKAISLDPECSEAYGNLGVEYTLAGRFDEAIAEFHHALALDPATAAHHSNLAFALIRISRNQEAADEAQTAISLDSTSSLAHFLLGYVLAQQPEKYDSAATHLTYAARTVPAAHLVLAQIYNEEGLVRNAQAEFDHYLVETAPAGKVLLNHGQTFLSPR